MFLSKFRKLSSPFFQRGRAFSMIRIDDKHTLTFPFNFAGVDVPLNNRYGQVYESALEEVFQVDIKEGFKYAFRNTVEAFLQKDFSYFKEICEPNLYYEIEKGLLNLDQMGLELEGEDFHDDRTKVGFSSMSLIYGVSPQRDDNFAEKLYSKRNFTMNGINVCIYHLDKDDPEYSKRLYPLIQVECIFYSRMNLLLKNKSGEIIEGTASNFYHKLVFESVAESEEPAAAKNMDKLLNSFSGVLGALNLIIAQRNMKGFLQNMFGADEVVWKIVDIDDHLQGNPHIV